MSDYMNQNELQHHGIPGMRWGIRRYQNKDGTLTAAGKRREAKLNKKMGDYARKYNKLKARKLTGKEEEEKPKTIRDLTNEELKSRTTRLNLEKDYLNAIKNRRDADAEPPKPVSKGKVFVGKMMKEYVAPAVLDVGKDYVKDRLGLNKEKESAKLKREAQDYENRRKIDIGQKYFNEGKYAKNN